MINSRLESNLTFFMNLILNTRCQTANVGVTHDTRPYLEWYYTILYYNF